MLLSIRSALHLRRQEVALARYKQDYYKLNNINHGLLSLDAWRDDLREILSSRIDSFSLTTEQEEILKSEITHILNLWVTQADSAIQQNRAPGSDFKRLAVNVFVNWDKIRTRIPEFTQTAVNEINNVQNKEQLKQVVEDKLDEFASITRNMVDQDAVVDTLLHTYNALNVNQCNVLITGQINRHADRVYHLTMWMIGLLLISLLPWPMFYREAALRKSLFVYSALLALIQLYAGLNAPMIDIDARIKDVDMLLLGKHLLFHDQVLFFQSKSIVQIVQILVEAGKADSVVVGCLILAFSILLPVTKLLSMVIYLLGPTKIKSNQAILFFTFKTGKWSMADVMVVAIFMAYVGFHGILENQLSKINMSGGNTSVITTNHTALQPGFVLFLSFVLYSMALSALLKRLEGKKGRIKYLRTDATTPEKAQGSAP